MRLKRIALYDTRRIADNSLDAFEFLMIAWSISDCNILYIDWTRKASALERPGLGFQGPGPVVAAGRAAEPLRPADGEQVLGTGAVIGEAALKRDQGTRVVGRGEGPSRHCSCYVFIMTLSVCHRDLVIPEREG